MRKALYRIDFFKMESIYIRGVNIQEVLNRFKQFLREENLIDTGELYTIKRIEFLSGNVVC